jgi:hypothetical protein
MNQHRVAIDKMVLDGRRATGRDQRQQGEVHFVYKGVVPVYIMGPPIRCQKAHNRYNARAGGNRVDENQIRNPR